MRCDGCGTLLRSRQATKADPYRYDESGVENVLLVGITVRSCICGDAPVIPDLPGLHREIAVTLATAPRPLAPTELAFLCRYAAVCATGLTTPRDRATEHRAFVRTTITTMQRLAEAPETERAELEPIIRAAMMRLLKLDALSSLVRAARSGRRPNARAGKTQSPRPLTFTRARGKPWHAASPTAHATAA